MASLTEKEYKAKIRESITSRAADAGVEIDRDRMATFFSGTVMKDTEAYKKDNSKKLTEAKAESRAGEFMKSKDKDSIAKSNVKFSTLKGSYNPIFDAINTSDIRTLASLVNKETLALKGSVDATVDDKSQFAKVYSKTPVSVSTPITTIDPTTTPTPTPIPVKDEIVSKDIVIIGAGPVGLYSIIRLIESAVPFEKITVFEKRSEDVVFSKEQQLFIENTVFNAFPDEIKKQLLAQPNACKMFRPSHLLVNYCFKTMKDDEVNGYSIKTNTLQTAFYNYVKTKSNIEFLFETNVLVIKDNKIQYPNEYGTIMQKEFDTLLISSGNPTPFLEPSNIGIKLKPIEDVPTLYGVSVNIKIDPSIQDKFPVQDKPTKENLAKFRNSRQQSKLRFFRQQQNDLYIGINIPKSEYDKLSTDFAGTTNQDKMILSVDYSDQRYLIDIVSAYTGVESSILNQKLTVDERQFSIFPINLQYASPAFSILANKTKIVYVAGDSAVMTHFFTGIGINIGLTSALKVVESIEKKNTLTDAYTEFINQSIESVKQKTKSIMIDFDAVKASCDADNVRERLRNSTDIDLNKLDDQDVCAMVPPGPPLPSPPEIDPTPQNSPFTTPPETAETNESPTVPEANPFTTPQQGGGNVTIPIELDPLQYAVVNSDYIIVKFLVEKGANYKSITSNGMTLLDLANSRKGAENEKKRVIDLMKAIRKATVDAVLDADKGQMKSDYGDGEFKDVTKKIYESEYKEIVFGKSDTKEVENKVHYEKGVKDGSVANQIRDPDYIKIDELGVKNKKYSEKQIDGYNLGYDVGRAKVDGARDGSMPNKDIDAEYGKGKDPSVQKAYNDAFSRSRYVDLNQGLLDGLAGATKKSDYQSSSTIFGLDSSLSQLIGLYEPIGIKSEKYQEGYQKGIAFLKTKLTDLENRARFYGRDDGSKGSKYESKLLIDYVDDKGVSKQVFMDFNNVDTLIPEVKRLKEAYDKAYIDGQQAIKVPKGGRIRRLTQRKKPSKK